MSKKADDLLFCYRWLLLELKREFAFEETLRMLEVLWSSLPPDWPCDGLQLFELRYTGVPLLDTSAAAIRPTLSGFRRRAATAYSKVCAIRRQSAGTLSLGNSPLLKKEFSPGESAATGMSASKRVQSLDGIAGDIAHCATSATSARIFREERQARKEKLLRERRLQSDAELAGSDGGRKIRDLGEFRRLTRQTSGSLTLPLEMTGDEGEPSGSLMTTSDELDYCTIECPAAAEMSRQRVRLEHSTSCFIQNAVAVENPVDISDNPLLAEEVEVGLTPSTDPISATEQELGAVTEQGLGAVISYSCENDVRGRLPAPQELGGGNPFLIFLCLSLLQQHRDVILGSRLDYQEIAMLFDKMVRKHDLSRTLEQARRMFSDYLKRDWSVASGSTAKDGADVGV
ncbi:TBC1 domain family member 25 [Amphibalanus amphitrite]|uniref:TBC1 domain family member 25 n=1 Tax=Amphibalanus amphitrite TaxID=1232801 RepID=A0A6A4X4N8_AMPAM|nr:TBC1 domain family member 25 [Amphibalanus amphitrite]